MALMGSFYSPKEPRSRWIFIWYAISLPCLLAPDHTINNLFSSLDTTGDLPEATTRMRPQRAQDSSSHEAITRLSSSSPEPTTRPTQSWLARGIHDSLEANFGERHGSNSPERSSDSLERNHDSLERSFDSPEHVSGDCLGRQSLAQVLPYLAKLLHYILARLEKFPIT
jgi:hypothetical protein